LVWCVKYRHSILTHEIGDRVKAIIEDLALELGCEIIAIETDVDHVHIVVRLKHTHTLSKIAHRFKGRTAYMIFREYPQLRNRLWGGHLWSPSYYAATVGGAPLETIKKYVESQREHE
jgi:putative transposase